MGKGKRGFWSPVNYQGESIPVKTQWSTSGWPHHTPPHCRWMWLIHWHVIYMVKGPVILHLCLNPVAARDLMYDLPLLISEFICYLRLHTSAVCWDHQRPWWWDLSVLLLVLFLICFWCFIQQDPKPGAFDASWGVRSRSRPEVLVLGPFSSYETDVICIFFLASKSYDPLN